MFTIVENGYQNSPMSVHPGLGDHSAGPPSALRTHVVLLTQLHGSNPVAHVNAVVSPIAPSPVDDGVASSIGVSGHTNHKRRCIISRRTVRQ